MNIEVKGVSKSYNGNKVLDNINIKMEGGRIYGFVGRNGSGKTMLMKCICGLVLPDEGEILIDGRTLGKNVEFPESVGALIETPGFIEHISAFDNLKELASIKKIATDEDIRNLLTEVGLDYKEKKRVKKYSLGMRQKLGIAMAFLEEPELIILDEPFNALDEISEKEVMEMILKRKNDSRLIIISCHDSEIIQSLSDEIIKISGGKTVCD